MHYKEAEKNYKLVKGKLYYKEQIQDGSDLDCLAVKKVKQTEFLECHLIVRGHRVRDATVGKVKEILLANFLQRNQGEGTHS